MNPAFICLVLLQPSAVPSQAPAPVKANADDFITVRNGCFVDQTGRQIILHGVNVGRKSKPYFMEHGEEYYARMRDWGFNCIRLLIFWAAIEPECGKYDDGYLAELDKRIAWAKANGIRVLLDMHQDCWGEKPRGDGAPGWATLDDGKMHFAPGPVWSDAYYTSPMIQAAFDNFWANKPGPDGVGIQDRFALAWQRVAQRYADESTVIGYDLLNEPFVGTPILTVPGLALPKLKEVLAKKGGEQPGLIELLSMIASDSGKVKLLDAVRSVEVYQSLLETVKPVFQTFEREKLSPMYRRVALAIRKVDTKHIIFLEPSVSSNLGMPSALEPLPDDPLQALAPHAYDIVVDTEAADQADESRIKLIFSRYAELARRAKLPVLIGEWGAFYGNTKVQSVARMFLRRFTEHLVGDTYWDADDNFGKTTYFESIQRPYPMAVAGELIRYGSDPDTRVFECAWKEDPKVTAPTVVCAPALWYPQGVEVRLDPAEAVYTVEQISEASASSRIVVPGMGQSAGRRIMIRPK